MPPLVGIWWCRGGDLLPSRWWNIKEQIALRYLTWLALWWAKEINNRKGMETTLNRNYWIIKAYKMIKNIMTMINENYKTHILPSVCQSLGLECMCVVQKSAHCIVVCTTRELEKHIINLETNSTLLEPFHDLYTLIGKSVGDV